MQLLDTRDGDILSLPLLKAPLTSDGGRRQRSSSGGRRSGRLGNDIVDIRVDIARGCADHLLNVRGRGCHGSGK